MFLEFYFYRLFPLANLPTIFDKSNFYPPYLLKRVKSNTKDWKLGSLNG